MSKVRVYEIARELNIDSKILLSRIKGMGITVSSHQSTLTDPDVERIRKAIEGDSASSSQQDNPPRAGANATTSTAGLDSSKPKVVVRRRRPSDSPGVETPQQETVVDAQPTQPGASFQTDSRELDITRSKAEDARDVSIPSLPESFEQKPIREVVSSAEITNRPSDTNIDPRPKPSELVRRPVSGGGGATIVRRATPEEIEAQNAKAAREAAQKSDQYSSRTQRREDSRGMRVTGVGLLQNRSESTSSRFDRTGPATRNTPANANQNFNDDFFSDTSRSDWGEKKSRRVQEDEDEAQKAARVLKQKRQSGINTRILLNQLEDEGDVTDTFSDEDLGETPVSKTVFTPGASDRTRKDMKRRKNLKKTEITVPRASYRIIKVEDSIPLGELAHQLNVKASELIKKLMTNGIMATVNQSLDIDTATLLANEYKFEVQHVVKTLEDIVQTKKSDAPRVARAPIVTVMGHVDHGKTSILDAIRKENVAAGEAGGITQHIGAYTVLHDDRRIAFLDTPGHEAFSSMRARGAKVTDIVVLVVAADDGVMPQTIEAISHAKSAGVPIIVAVNKIDKPNVNFDRLYSQLAEHGIQSEEWGGEHQFVKVSALQGTGIAQLLDAILLQAEILELTAQREAPASGTVIEAHLDKGRGAVATVMVQNGTLRLGDFIVAGTASGKVRAMLDHNGSQLEETYPSTPVAIFGLDSVPSAGDLVHVVEDERQATEVIEYRINQQRKASQPKTSAASLDDLLGKVQTAESLDVSYLVKADTQGSLEAIVDALLKLSTKKVTNKIVHKAVGGITESDVNLASTSGAVILGFNVRAAKSVEDLANRNDVAVKYFSIIYELVDAAKAIMTGKLPPIVTEVVLGHAQVRQPISVPKIGTIAGSAVLDGKITRSSNLRLIRDNVVIYNGKIGSLRRFKDDVKEVQSGYECGISIEGYNDVREGDIIEAYVLEESAPSLS